MKCERFACVRPVKNNAFYPSKAKRANVSDQPLSVLSQTLVRQAFLGVGWNGRRSLDWNNAFEISRDLSKHSTITATVALLGVRWKRSNVWQTEEEILFSLFRFGPQRRYFVEGDMWYTSQGGNIGFTVGLKKAFWKDVSPLSHSYFQKVM